MGIKQISFGNQATYFYDHYYDDLLSKYDGFLQRKEHF